MRTACELDVLGGESGDPVPAAFSYLVLGHVFVANMTGNVVFSGFAIAGAAGFSLTASLAALAAFALGALLGGRLAHRARAHRGRVLRLALLLETALVLVAYVVAEVAATPYPRTAKHALIALLGLAMGVQNAAARALAVPDLTTTVLTLTITGVAADSRAAGGKGGRAAGRDAARCRRRRCSPAASSGRSPSKTSSRPHARELLRLLGRSQAGTRAAISGSKRAAGVSISWVTRRNAVVSTGSATAAARRRSR